MGCAVAAQSPTLVPADGALYALRDATATVPSIPLIAASVMSKKLAVETDLILLDVKAGSGAFMKTPDDARELAEACLRLAEGWGRDASAAVTDMSQPLGDAVGNALDVVEAVEVLGGGHHGRLRELTVRFAARALERTTGAEHEEALARAAAALDGGAALERFRDMVAAQGGDPRVVDDPRESSRGPPSASRCSRTGAASSPRTPPRRSASRAWPSAPGRRRKGDPIDPAVGIVVRPKMGDRLEPGSRSGRCTRGTRTPRPRRLAACSPRSTSPTDPVEPPPLVHAWI